MVFILAHFIELETKCYYMMCHDHLIGMNPELIYFQLIEWLYWLVNTTWSSQDTTEISQCRIGHLYIYDDKLINLRMELVKNGMATAEWILTYFRVCPDVTMWQYPRRNTFEMSFQLGQLILANNCFEIITSNYLPKIGFSLYIRQAPPNYPIGSFFHHCHICSLQSTTAPHSHELEWSNPCNLQHRWYHFLLFIKW
jgi:hypothetical protein